MNLRDYVYQIRSFTHFRRTKEEISQRISIREAKNKRQSETGIIKKPAKEKEKLIKKILTEIDKCPVATIHWKERMKERARQWREEFRDELSKKEFKISKLCQKCQDEAFGDDYY